MPKIEDLVKNGVNTYSYYQPEEKPPEDGNFVRGFKRAMYQIPETLGGTAALVGDVVGSEGLRDYGMGVYEKNHAKSEELTKPSDSLTSVLQGEEGASAGDFLAGSAGYVAGQALTALGTGGAGGFIGSQLAKRGIGTLATKAAEKQIAARGAKLGAGAALFGSNVSQEAGSIYPEALAQAKKEDRTLDGGDKARIIGSALTAAGVETAADALMLKGVLKGGRKAGEGMGKAALREVPGAMAREAATEGVQTGIERYGAGQELTTAEAIRDYVDSMGVGAIGGGLGGAASVLREHKVPESGPLSRAANEGIEQKALQLENKPDSLISFPDGSVGTMSAFETAIASLPPEEQLAERRRVMGRDPETGKRIEPEPAPEPVVIDSEANSKARIKALSDNRKPVTLDYAQTQLKTPAAKGLDLMITPHASGKGYIVVPSKWLTLHGQTQAMALQNGDEGRLPGPDREAPSGRMLVDSEGGAAKETYGDQSRTAAAVKKAKDEADAAAARRQELGTPVPYGTKVSTTTGGENGASNNSNKPEDTAGNVGYEGGQQNGTQEAVQGSNVGGGRGVVSGQDNVDGNAAVDNALILKKGTKNVSSPGRISISSSGGRNGTQRDDNNGRAKQVVGQPVESSGSDNTEGKGGVANVEAGERNAGELILNPQGKPFVTEFSAKRKLTMEKLGDTHEIAKVPDGYVVQRKQAPANDLFDQAAHEAATSELNDKPQPTEAQKAAGNYQKGHVKLHGLDISIENPVGSTRSGVGTNGKPWSNTMQNHYGYIKRSEGADGDHVDTFIGNNRESDKVFIVNQTDPDTGNFDETKVMLGFDSLKEAKAAYKANYSKGWKGGKDVSETSVEGFKAWLKDGDTKKPFKAVIKSAEKQPEPAQDKASGVVTNDAKPQVERRKDSATRKKISDMTPDEMRVALLTDDMTQLGNRRAYEESHKKPFQASIDIDSLKWVNDNMGHASGDNLIRLIGRALKEQTADAYHLSGDEFVAQFDDEAAGAALLESVRDRLRGATIEITRPDGTVVTKTGLEFSYGIAPTLNEADTKLAADKVAREASGERAGRGERPTGITERPAEGKPDNEGDAAADQAVAAKEREKSAITPDVKTGNTIHDDGLPADLENDKNASSRWNYGKELQPYQKRLMDAVKQVYKDANGEFVYASQLYERAKKILGDYVPKSAWDAQSDSERGPMGMELYRADKRVSEDAGREAIHKKQEEESFKLGDKFSKLKTNDGQTFTGASITEIDNNGENIEVSAVRGGKKYTFKTDALKLSRMISRVEPKSKALQKRDAKIAKQKEISISDIKVGDQFETVLKNNIAATGGTISKIGRVNFEATSKYMGRHEVTVKLPIAQLDGGKIVRDGVVYSVSSAAKPVEEAKTEKAPALQERDAKMAAQASQPQKKRAARKEAKPSADDEMLPNVGAEKTDSAAFKKWFGDSKVVDADGKPLVVYHGSGVSIREFHGQRGDLIYFSPSSQEAERYAKNMDEAQREMGNYDDDFGRDSEDGGATIYPVYLSVQNPFDPDIDAHLQKVAKEASEKEGLSEEFIAERLKGGSYDDIEQYQSIIKSAGFDGVYVRESPTVASADRDIAVFSAEQIKSATGNNGAFDPSNPSILGAAGDQSNVSDFDKSLYADIGAGKSSTDLLKSIAKESTNPQHRELAQALIDAGVKSKIEHGSAGGKKFNVSRLPAGVTYTAAFNPQTDTVMMFQAHDAEKNILHELVHAATHKAVSGNGIMSTQMKYLYHHVNRSGQMGKMYGMENHDEFVAEALSNPEFQDKLRAIKAMPEGSKFANAWEWFINLVRRAVGLPTKYANALEQALRFGRGMMDENNAVSSKAVDQGEMAQVSKGRDILKELSKHDEIFRIKRSDGDTVEAITADVDPSIEVKKLTNIPGETRYNFTLPDGRTARMMVRPWNKHGNSIYGFDLNDGEMSNMEDGRPGRNAEEADGKDDVWIDVSLLNEGGGYGSKIYAIAANYAHNTGKVFIGDPAGLSDEALIRRPEQMLSSALKFGTTEHLAPHPRQINGDKKIGVGPLDWVYGDDIGNIQKLIALNLANIENNGGNGGITYDTSNGQFTDADGNTITREDIGGLAGAGLGREAKAGGATLARSALLRSLASESGGKTVKGDGKSDGAMESLIQQLRQYGASDGTPLEKIFYNQSKLNGELLANVGRAADSFLGKLGVQENIRNNVSDLFQSEKTFNGWWHRTVGTQYHKAQIDHHFKRVYDATQRYISTVSAFANEAADFAPTLLPKLDGLRDLTKKPPSTVDTQAAGRAIFEGTLNDHKVYTDDELRTQYNLTQPQIDLYREFRAATDKSLDDMGKTDILRYAGDDGAHLTNAVLAAKDVSAGAKILTDHLKAIKEEDAAKVIQAKADRLEQLKTQGYAPLMRFGEHTVYVTDKNGNQVFFGMAETGREAAKLARDMKETYPDATVTQGVLSTEGAKLFAGISPDTIEVFAQTTGLDKNPLFQDYLKLVINNRSALKRLIERKGVAGFSQDTTRVLASFLTSNARASSKNLHGGEMSKAANDIPKEKGDVRDEAIRLVDYIQNPVEEAAKFRGLLFTNFIGGSIASAAVNMTQPVMMTLPYLSQFGGAVKAAKTLGAAMKMAAMGNSSIQDKQLSDAMHRAEREGIVSPQEIHNLQAEAMRSSKGITIGGKQIVPAFAARKMALVWGGFFGLAEQFNRRATFIAAYQMAKDMTPAQFEKAGVANAYEFAAKSIAETQGTYNRGNRPDWARGALGATLMTFKQYSIHYMEFLKRLPPKERALAMGLLVVAAGANGLPFADDLDDVIDTIGQALGYNFNTKKAKQRFATNILGENAANFVLHGFSGVGGLPLDVSMRMGMGNLLPGTGLLMKSETDKTQQMAEFFGAAGGYGQKVLKAGDKLLSGDPAGALMAMASTAVSNAAKAVDMMQTDAYRDSRGRKVMDTDMIDAVVKGLGFQPSNVAKEQEKLSSIRQDIAMANAVKAEIADKWAQGVFEKDPQAAAKAREAINKWNDKNPDSRINVTMDQIAKRVRAMRTEKQDRMIKTAPKTMRQSIREELS